MTGKSNWGGAREGAGRPPTNRKSKRFQLSEEEFAVIKPFVDFVRQSEDNIVILEKIIKELKV